MVIVCLLVVTDGIKENETVLFEAVANKFMAIEILLMVIVFLQPE